MEQINTFNIILNREIIGAGVNAELVSIRNNRNVLLKRFWRPIDPSDLPEEVTNKLVGDRIKVLTKEKLGEIVNDYGYTKLPEFNHDYDTERFSLSRIFKEIFIHSKIMHPNIIESGGDVLFIPKNNRYNIGFLVQRIHGNSLLKTVESVDTTNPAEGFEIRKTKISNMIGAAKGLDHLSSLGLIHRDIKPDNMLEDLHGNILLCDLGIVLNNFETISRDNVVGSVAFMAPEQMSGHDNVILTASDEFSFALSLQEMIYGDTNTLRREGDEIMNYMIRMIRNPNLYDFKTFRDHDQKLGLDDIQSAALYLTWAISLNRSPFVRFADNTTLAFLVSEILNGNYEAIKMAVYAFNSRCMDPKDNIILNEFKSYGITPPEVTEKDISILNTMKILSAHLNNKYDNTPDILTALPQGRLTNTPELDYGLTIKK